MAERLKRQELYQLVWPQPMKTLAVRFGISDVALKKTCARAAVPVSGRGHWAKKDAGKRVVQANLPPRPPGMDDEALVGSGGQYWHRNWTQEKLLGPLPAAPAFSEPIESVRNRIAKTVGRVTAPRNVKAWHPVISRLLAKDEERRQKQRSSRYSFSWDAPFFDSPFERRRLRILNSLFLATARMDGKPEIRGRETEEIYISFHQRHVAISLDRPKTRRVRGRALPRNPGSDDKSLRLAIRDSMHAESDRRSWQDEDEKPLEHHLAEITVEIVLTAERQYREGTVRQHEWRVERKAQLEQEERKRRLEAERAERERRTQLEQARVDRLLSDADAFKRASVIRSYVDKIRSAVERGEVDVSEADIARWSEWALGQANRIDPLTDRKSLDAMKDKDDE